MTRIVVDANVWVSSALFPESIPDQVVKAVQSGRVISVTSEPIVEQVQRSLLNPKLNEQPERVQRLIAQMITVSILVYPMDIFTVITAKESDNRVLECAVAGHADLIVTGDRKHLLSLAEYRGIRIITPRQFVDENARAS